MSTAAYSRVASWLDSISWRGIKPGLDRTRALLHQVGDPDAGLHGVLVAGTNGKGSVCAIVDSVIRAAGLRSVLLTKPHLWSYTERFVVDGTPLTDDGFAQLFDEVSDAAHALPEELTPTAFEMLTVAGILLAARAEPDVLVCEVGVGGRLDSTNVLDLGVAVVTNVDLDHRDLLGDTIPAIAREKAAIIKRANAAITGATQPALGEIAARAIEEQASLTVVGHRLPPGFAGSGREVPAAGESLGWAGVRVRTEFAGAALDVRAPLLGAHQVGNVAIAVAVCDELRRRGRAIDRTAVAAGCARARWPGRLHWVDGRPGWLVDGAHNPAAMDALVAAAADLLRDRRVVVLFGVMRDKERGPMVASLRRLNPAAVVLSAPPVDRAASPEELAADFTGATVTHDVDAAMEAAAALAGQDGAVVACGSLYLAGEVLSRLGAL
ncbi:MAG: bifunctional folylpolyglutamate synthase/dihydrofolate synthase [Candidatus Dormibacteraeota bacterium]|nr:bifunctional folylpolyglutamate synthase/dihydrofolate synthase [Candidatus Dormibacteraeota bacterium]